MKLFLSLVIMLAAADGASTVTYVDHDKVAAALAKGGSLVTSPDYLVSGSHRSGRGQVEVHEKETDVIYVVDGEATFVTKATLRDNHQHDRIVVDQSQLGLRSSTTECTELLLC